MLKHWLLLIGIILGPPYLHPYIQELSVLVESAEEVIACLCAQACHHQDMPEDPICLLQIEFNYSFRKVFLIPLTVLWPHFVPLVMTLTTVHFS